MPQIREHVELAQMTTFKIGGTARYYAEADNDESLRAAVLWARSKAIPFTVISGGSNMLLPDDELDVLVIHLTSHAHAFEGVKLTADAGCSLLDLIKRASILGLGGWEKLAGIPGTIGGAVRGNAGAFGTEIKDVLAQAIAFNSITLEIRAFSNTECDFAYRNSYFKQNPEWIIVRAVIFLQKVQAGDSIRLIDETVIERERRHLQNVQAAGSFFKNPVAPESVQAIFEQEKNQKPREGRVPAGWLIEKVGLKGARVGGAIASEQHPNYIVNTGNATAEDVLQLAAKIKLAVKEAYGIEMEEEAAIIR